MLQQQVPHDPADRTAQQRQRLLGLRRPVLVVAAHEELGARPRPQAPRRALHRVVAALLAHVDDEQVPEARGGYRGGLRQAHVPVAEEEHVRGAAREVASGGNEGAAQVVGDDGALPGVEEEVEAGDLVGFARDGLVL